jgi:RNA polymerase sigma factor (sigma-70 family)
MATSRMRGVFAALTRAELATDSELLQRFTRNRDESAFAEVLRRHAPLVLGVCRRIVSDSHLAEDAFQAVFVILATQAKKLDTNLPLGPWLYGVAFRVSLRARTMIGRRRKRETLTQNLPEVIQPAVIFDDLAAVVDEEIAKLSAVCREAVVLCELQGVSRREAAERLGIAEGTLSSRLAAARKTLAGRLRARGATLGAGLNSTVLVPADLLATTVATSTGKVALSTQLLSLIQGVTHLALLSKLKLLVVAAVFVVLTVGGVGTVGGWRGSESNAAPVPKVEKDDGLIWTMNDKSGTLTAYTLDGKKDKELTLKDGKHFLGFTPDGTKIAFAGKKGKLAAEGDTDGLTLHVREVNNKTEGTDTGLSLKPGDGFRWSPDSKQVVRMRFDELDMAGGMTYEHVLFDLATKKEKKLDLPVNHYMIRWAADGKTWLLHEYVRADLRNPNLPRYRMMSVPVGGGNVTPLCDGANLTTFEPAEDGKTFHGVGNAHKNPEDDTDATYRRWFRVSGGQATLVKMFDDFDFIDLRVAPDRKRIAVLGKTGQDDSSDTSLLLYDPDGTNEQKLVTLRGDGQHTQLLGWFSAKPDDARKKNAPKAEKERVILAAKLSLNKPGEVLQVVDTDGKNASHLPVGELTSVQRARVSPDGKRLAFIGGNPIGGKVMTHYHEPQDVYVVVLPLNEPPKEPTFKGVLDPHIAWAADGQSVYLSRIADGTDVSLEAAAGKLLPRKTVRYDLATKKETEVELPTGHEVQDVSPDGKTMLTRTVVWNGIQSKTTYSSFVVPLDTLKPKAFGEADDEFMLARFSPDGKKVAGIQTSFVKSKQVGVFVADLADGKFERVPLEVGVLGGYGGVTWAPDGKQLGILWMKSLRPPVGGSGFPPGGPPDLGPGVAWLVTVMETTGEKPKAVREFPLSGENIRSIEWANPKLAEPAQKDDPRKKENAPELRMQPRSPRSSSPIPSSPRSSITRSGCTGRRLFALTGAAWHCSGNCLASNGRPRRWADFMLSRSVGMRSGRQH